MTDILDIRSDISRRVVEALKVQLGVSETERLVKKPTEMTEAYDSYLLGRYELNKFTEGGFNSAVQHFKRALERDPSFALANAGLSDAYSMLGYWNYLPPKEAFPEAKRAAARALELDPKLAEAHSALGFVQYEYEWRFNEAEREFKEAVRLNPGSATARFWFAEFLLQLGRFREGEEQLQSALCSHTLRCRGGLLVSASIRSGLGGVAKSTGDRSGQQYRLSVLRPSVMEERPVC